MCLEEINIWISGLSKEDSLSPMWGHHSILRDLREQKTGRVDSLFLLELGHPSSGLKHQSSWFSSLQTQTGQHRCLSWTSTCRQQIRGPSVSIPMNHIFMVSSSDLYACLPCIYHLSIYLFIYPSISYWPISLENPDWYRILGNFLFLIKVSLGHARSLPHLPLALSFFFLALLTFNF